MKDRSISVGGVINLILSFVLVLYPYYIVDFGFSLIIDILILFVLFSVISLIPVLGDVVTLILYIIAIVQSTKTPIDGWSIILYILFGIFILIKIIFLVSTIISCKE